MVAHRMSTLRTCDKIVFMVPEGVAPDGSVEPGARVGEEGTHEELMAKGGLYKSFYDEMMRCEQPAQLAPATSADRLAPQPAQRPRACEGGCGFCITWHSTHCCGVCAKAVGKHGPRCEKVPWQGETRS